MQHSMRFRRGKGDQSVKARASYYGAFAFTPAFFTCFRPFDEILHSTSDLSSFQSVWIKPLFK
jgi:hypothetical protein